MSFVLSLSCSLRLCLRLAVILFLFCAGNTWAGEEGSGRIQISFGRITGFNGDISVNGEPGNLGMRVFQGDVIKTGEGKAEIKTDKSRFLIGPFSEITLGRPPTEDDSSINVRKGTLRSIIHMLLHGGFRVKTHNTVIGVRGTDFVLHATPRASVVFAREGQVLFTAEGKTVQLDHMTMTQGGERIPPLESESVDSNKQLADLMKEVEQSCELTIPPGLAGRRGINNIIARWNLNYSNYLVEKQEFEKSRKLCSLASLIAELRTIKGEALLSRGMISFMFMEEQKAALEDFDAIINDYADTDFAESALYYKGLIYFNMGASDKARRVLDKYEQSYPQGKFKENAMAILKRLSGQ